MKKQIRAVLIGLAVTLQAAAYGSFDDFCAYCFGFDSAVSIDIGAGYRNDNFKWTTLRRGDPDADIERRLNEKWRNIGMGVFETNIQFLACEHWLFKFDFDLGWFNRVKQLRVEGFNFRNNSFIEQRSRVSGYVYDVSTAIGYQFNLDYFCLSFAPLAGWSYDYQHFRNHIFRHKDTRNEFKANNRHRFSWNGPWIGFAAVYQICCPWQLYLDYAYHWTQFKAHFHDRFLSPSCRRGHSHADPAYGNEVTVGTTYQFCDDWFLGFKFNYKCFWAKRGRTSVKFEDRHLRQKNIRWESYYGTVEIGYTF